DLVRWRDRIQSGHYANRKNRQERKQGKGALPAVPGRAPALFARTPSLYLPLLCSASRLLPCRRRCRRGRNRPEHSWDRASAPARNSGSSWSSRLRCICQTRSVPADRGDEPPDSRLVSSPKHVPLRPLTSFVALARLAPPRCSENSECHLRHHHSLRTKDDNRRSH